MTIARDSHGERLKTAPQPLPFSHQNKTLQLFQQNNKQKTRINRKTTTESFLAATQSTQHR